MNIYEMKLATEPFKLIKKGIKTIESRLNDEKRQQIKVGDTIIFKNRDNQTEIVKTNVVGLLYLPTFGELFDTREPQSFGKKTLEELKQQIYQFYTKEEEAKFGVVGIQIEVVK